MSYEEASSEVEEFSKTGVSISTTRRKTLANGFACEEYRQEQAGELEEKGTEETEKSDKVMQLSADGCFIALTDGQWREVKTLLVGEVQTQWDEKQHKHVATTSDLSYVSSSETVREFEKVTTVEVVERGVGNAKEVISLNDGASWIQSVTDYHCPDAVRILDLRHAQEYLADAGKAVFDEQSDSFRSWFTQATDRLVNKPPQQTLSRLQLLAKQAPDEERASIVEDAHRYLNTRKAMIDYPHFRQQPYPIGSGAIESAHKHVVQARMKQAGMRWKLENVEGMLCLRNLIANDRWHSGWDDILSYRIAQRWVTSPESASPPVSPPVTLDSLAALPEPPSSSDSHTEKQPYKPSDDHPWKLGIYPDPRFR